MLKGFIFDMDGTITLSQVLHHDAYAEVLRDFGIDYTVEEDALKYAGSGSKHIFTSVFSDHGVKISEEELEKCVVRKKDLYKKFVQERDVPVVPGVREFLEKTDRLGLKRIIATGNSDLSSVRYILEKVGLSDFFPNLLSITEVPRGKPFPDVFLEAAKRLRLANDECIVLEDAVNGVTAAKAAGIRCIALLTTTPAEKLRDAGASKVVRDYTELTDEILQSNL